jgi:hypothetical protein
MSQPEDYNARTIKEFRNNHGRAAAALRAHHCCSSTPPGRAPANLASTR